MNTKFLQNTSLILSALLALAAVPVAQAQMHMAMGNMIEGINGPNITLTAKSGYISSTEGNHIYFWGYANGSGPDTVVQYPGPTLIINQGETVTITLNNELPVPVSILFPGQSGVTSVNGSKGILAREAAPGNQVQYTFTATRPGTFLYHSGTQPELQIEMGLSGALIVRPTGMPMQAYSHPDTAFDHEYLFFLTEMDEKIHDQVEHQVQKGESIQVDTTQWWPVYWFINGRCGPDTMWPKRTKFLPHQPYDCMPMFHPGERVLMRIIGAGRDPHPFHHHGNHSQVIAKDGRVLNSTGNINGAPNLAETHFTIAATPGGTVDALFSWTGQGMGWDLYGHTAENGGELQPFEDPRDHLKPFPVMLPNDQHLTLGMMYSGSPFMGSPGILPPGDVGFNPVGGFSYMWHSHAEKEICNNNIFPGGMLTMVIVEAWPTLMVSPATLPPAQRNVAYSQNLSATMIKSTPPTMLMPPITWAKVHGTLPPGITLSAGGVLSGTPTATGSYSFTVKVMDHMSVGAKALTLIVNP